MHDVLVLYSCPVPANTPMESNGQGRGAWSSLVKQIKANLNFYGSLIVAILSGREFQYFIVLGKKEYL